MARPVFSIPWVGWLATAALLFGLGTTVTQLQAQRLEQQRSPRHYSLLQRRQEEQRTRSQLQFLGRMPSLGYDNLVAGWAFLGFLQYFGDTEARQQVGHGLSPEFFEIIVARDPRFVHPYLFLSTSISLFAGQPERSVALMIQGSQAMTPTLPPGGYRLWRYLGIDQLLFLGQGEAAKQSFLTAALWADQSPEPEAAAVAQASRQTAAFLSQNPASRAAQISAWIQVLNLAVDERVQRRAIERIQALGGEILALKKGQVTVRYRED
jgi:hypothetical protein